MGSQSEEWSAMGVEKPELTGQYVDFIKKSPVYFIATAPIGIDGHVNCTPRPMDWSFFAESSRLVGWFDLVGSGVETIAHLKENGRIVLMFCSFGSKPLILRLHGKGSVYEPGDEEFESRVSMAGHGLGIRAVVTVDVERVSTSCGNGVPVMDFVSHRSTIGKWLENKGESGLLEYRRNNNLLSIDGLAGLDPKKIL
ncbi:MAG: pyridoxamine 5'-phosphate oxidase family protein [Actinomycetota bacterium]|nr:pyridoxamine 5'-phosphate oxidase family protein [Actinomycetota bacterium]